jgi:hypothetical protein
MSYTVINSQMFTAAFAGALAGMGVSGRIITDSVPDDYAGLVAVAGAFAQSFDTVWNSAAAVGTLEVSIAQEAAEGIWSGRSPNPADTNTLVASTWTPEAAALKALIIKTLADYTANNYPNPSTGGGGLPEYVFGHITAGSGIPATPGLVGTQATFPSWSAGDTVIIECSLTVSAPLFFIPPYTVGLIPVVSFDDGVSWNAASDSNVQSAQITSNDPGNLVVSVITAVECPSAPKIGMFAYAPSDCQVNGGATIVAARVKAVTPTGNTLVPYPNF